MFTEWSGYFKLPENVASALTRILLLNKDSPEDEWLECLEELEDYDGFISNDQDLAVFPSKRWTFLHHAVYHQAPISVLKEMDERKFVRSLKDSEYKIAIDYLRDDVSEDYKALVTPLYKLENLDLTKLNKIEEHFHQVILSRVEDLVTEHHLILPMLSVFLETTTEDEEWYFAVPGMYGGFTMSLSLNKEKNGVEMLKTSSWCRVAGGSGQSHECTDAVWKLTNEGFC